MARVLIVDDQLPIQRLLQRLLDRAGHVCTTAGNAEEARALLREEPYDVILSDVHMPGTSGLDLVREIVVDYPDMAVLMVTAVDDPEVGRVAVDLGASGYIIKPFEPNEVIINVMNAMRRRELERENRAHREHLEKLVTERTRELERTFAQLQQAHGVLQEAQAEVIHRLSMAAEFRDEETGQHVQRMSQYSALLADLAGLPEGKVDLVRLASPLHDVGKIGIPDAILQKPGRLTPAEFDIMRKHAEIGYHMLRGSGYPVLDAAATIAWTHHEKWGGTGYPRGLTNTDIPVEGRIVAVADVFDALTTRRVYKPAYSIERSLEIMREGRGLHFDPRLLDLFVAHIDDFLAIRDRFPDAGPLEQGWPMGNLAAGGLRGAG